MVALRYARLHVCTYDWRRTLKETGGVLAARLEQNHPLQICAHTHARTQREAHRVRNRRSFLKSFSASNLASSTLCVLSFSPSHSFIYIPFSTPPPTPPLSACFCMLRE